MLSEGGQKAIGRNMKCTIEQMLDQIEIFVDACAFHPPVKEEKQAMLELLMLEEKGKIQLKIAKSTEEELMNAPHNMQKHRFNRIIAYPFIESDEEKRTLIEIESTLFPNRKNIRNGERSDAEHIFCAHKYGCRYFITYDKRHILSKRDMLLKKWNIIAVTPVEGLDYVREEIKRALRISGKTIQ